MDALNIECLGSQAGENYLMVNGDCCEVIPQLPDDSVDMIIYSPPFSSLYTYSDSARDMGNCSGDGQFFDHYGYLLGELLRVLKPGRLAAVHVSDIPATITHDGYVGLRDFSGMVIKSHMDVTPDQGPPWVYHGRCTIWKDPVVEMQRTKALGLLWKQIRKDSTRSRMGMPDYLLFFRKGDRASPVPVSHTAEDFPVGQWQQWASPVWMDIDQTDTLNVRAAREDGDERHMCPLQLGVIDRAIRLYSNPEEVILSPFGGVGSEGVGAIRAGRRYFGVELKRSYFDRACVNLDREDNPRQVGLFG